jgi:D-glycero-alpha-D-manno-heptose-7-phosphate kinase
LVLKLKKISTVLFENATILTVNVGTIKMIISRTPFRISFVGGGTDLRSFYSQEEGRVLSTSIDKFIYVVVKKQVSIVESKYRINWRKVEFADSIDEIEHPIVRETLRLMEIDFPIEITTFADIPANTGLGSSSSFTVGLLNALYALKGEMVTKSILASQAAQIEVNILGRNMGTQDHYAAAYGNMNVFTFHKNDEVTVDPVFYRPEVRRELENNLMLFYTAQKRDASEVLRTQNEKTEEKIHVLKGMKNLVPKLRGVISEGKKLHEFGEILHEGWLMKKSLTTEISSNQIDTYYEKALKAGALGGKLLGAGGGGFLLFYVEPQNQMAVAKSLPDLFQLKFRFDSGGTRITYYDQPFVEI